MSLPRAPETLEFRVDLAFDMGVRVSIVRARRALVPAPAIIWTC